MRQSVGQEKKSEDQGSSRYKHLDLAHSKQAGCGKPRSADQEESEPTSCNLLVLPDAHRSCKSPNISKIAEILERANVDPRVALADVAKMVSLRAVREGTLDVITSDVSDNRILECALHSKADYVVTGDLHLLELEDFRDIKIITVREFIKAMKPQQTVV